MKLNLSLKASLGVEMSLVTDEQVVAQLDSLGVPSEYFFLFPVEGSGIGGLIGSWHPEIGFRCFLIDISASCGEVFVIITLLPQAACLL
jgi:hypothetical protein